MAKSITVFVDDDFYKKVEAAAKKEGLTLKSFLSEAVKKWLRKKIKS